MRISDWSSDVCSSDLSPTSVLRSRVRYRRSCAIIVILLENQIALGGSKGSVGFVEVDDHRRPVERGAELRGVALDSVLIGSEERRVGTESVRTCKSRWSPYI